MANRSSDMYDEKADFVDIADYDPSWPGKAETLIGELKTHFFNDDNVIDYAHIGSTAVPRCPAKPIIDIYIGVTSIDTAKQRMVATIEKMDYQYWADNPNPNKMMFVKGMPPFGDKRTHHIHIVVFNSDYWKARLAFRDYMRTHPDAVLEYAEKKKQLAHQHTYDREAYSDGKNAIVTDILNRAGFKGYMGR